MLSHKNALEILRLSTDITHTAELVEQAYIRLIRRYPPEQFPEKFPIFKEARDYLLNDLGHWHRFIQAESVDLSFLELHLERPAEQPADADLDHKRFRMELVRTIVYE